MYKNLRSGNLRSNLSGDLTYQSFCPSPLPPELELDEDLMTSLIEAHRMLAVLDDRALNIPTMNLFISISVQKEALLSSQIEGTQATLEDIFDPKREESVNADVSEVVNYIQATHYAIQRLETLPLCNRLLLETHQVLLRGVRGREKNPGEFRRSQNWIGGHGSSLQTARYIPPNLEDMQEALGDLENYMNESNNYDPLIKAALIHYQFETIHPFLDGNGRIGRLLIVLYLLDQAVISTPALYLSYYLKENRIEYYDRMTAVREQGTYEQWIKFFIDGIVVSAQSAIQTADDSIQLTSKDRQSIENSEFSARGRETLLKVFAYLLSHPIIETSTTAKDLGIAYNTVKTAIDRLEILGILQQVGQQKRNKVYIYDAYLAILRPGTENI